MDPNLDDTREAPSDSEREKTEDERTDEPSSAETPVTSATSTGGEKADTDVRFAQDDETDVFDGYSFKGRQSVILDGEEEEEEVSDHEEPHVDEIVHLGSDVEAADEASDLPTDQERDTLPTDDDKSEISIKAPVPVVPEHQPSLEERPASKPPSVHDVEILPAAEPAAEVELEAKPEAEDFDAGISDLFTTGEMFLALQTPLPPSPLRLSPEIPPHAPRRTCTKDAGGTETYFRAPCHAHRGRGSQGAKEGSSYRSRAAYGHYRETYYSSTPPEVRYPRARSLRRIRVPRRYSQSPDGYAKRRGRVGLC